MRRGLQLVALATMIMALLATGAGAQTEDPPAERITRADARRARAEGSVDVESLGALTAQAGADSTGAGGTSACRWQSVWRVDGPLPESVAALSLRGELQPDPSANANFANAFRVDLDSKGVQLVEAGADPELLRYVVPYGSPTCAASAGAFVTLAEVQDLARAAFDELKTRWPRQDIVLGWPEPTEDTWTALATGLPWSPISATASSGGLTVTVTADPLRAEWDTGQINTRVGGERMTVCEGPGDLPRFQEDAACRVWFASPSTGLADRRGQADSITLGLTVEWNVGYESNIAGFADPEWLVWPTESYLDGVVVNTTQAVGIRGA